MLATSFVWVASLRTDHCRRCGRVKCCMLLLVAVAGVGVVVVVAARIGLWRICEVGGEDVVTVTPLEKVSVEQQLLPADRCPVRERNNQQAKGQRSISAPITDP